MRTLTRPSMRILEYGDLIINELEANWIGYRSQGVQPVFVGAADPLHQELIKVQREIFNRVMEHLKPGVTVKELAELTIKTAAAAAPKSGLAAGARGDLNMHGRGAGDDGPIITAHAKSPRQLGVDTARKHGLYLQTVSDLPPTANRSVPGATPSSSPPTAANGSANGPMIWRCRAVDC